MPTPKKKKKGTKKKGAKLTSSFVFEPPTPSAEWFLPEERWLTLNAQLQDMPAMVTHMGTFSSNTTVGEVRKRLEKKFESSLGEVTLLKLQERAFRGVYRVDAMLTDDSMSLEEAGLPSSESIEDAPVVRIGFNCEPPKLNSVLLLTGME